MQAIKRFRRLRANEAIRSAVRENHLKVSDFMYPVFVVEGQGIRRPIEALPGIDHLSVDVLEEEVLELKALGINSILIFGVPSCKDGVGSEAYAQEGIVQRAIAGVKRVCKDMYVASDVCLCQYTDHGHCGVLSEAGEVVNDATLELLKAVALSHAQAGADMVAPSDMMDGRVGALREALDGGGYEGVALMAYSVKYASSFYGPFREAAGSAPQFGDRKSYQMDFHNAREAQRVVDYDLESGADIIIVKPAMAYLDVVARLKDRVKVPLAVYNVSGEYAMLKNAVAGGIMHENVIYETLIAMKRAGADIIITYFAKEMAQKIKGGLL